MALRSQSANAHAWAASPWPGGSFTITGWVWRPSSIATARFLMGLLDTDDTTPETTGDPRATINTATLSTVSSSYTGAGASTSDVSTATYTSGSWFLVVGLYTATGTLISQTEVALNGTRTGSPGVSNREMSTNGVLDYFQIGSNTTNHSNADFRWVAFFPGKLSDSQITELLTKTPLAITGITPVLAYDLANSGVNLGSGGDFYDLTLSGATFNSTNDASFPSLSSGGGSSGTVAVTDAGDVVSVVGSSPAAVAVVDAGDVVAVSGNGGASTVRLQLGIELERGALASSLSGLRWVAFGPNFSTIVASGSTLTTDANGVATIDLVGSGYSVGDYVPLMVAQYDSGVSAPDRYVRSFLGFVPAVAVA